MPPHNRYPAPTGRQSSTCKLLAPSGVITCILRSAIPGCVGNGALCVMQGAVAATHMVATFAAAGLPPGVINLVTGRDHQADQLMW